MRKFIAPKPASLTLNLAPMVDVMMCLIIFFLLASQWIDSQNRPLKLAYAQTAEEDQRSLGARVVINVRPNADDPERVEFVVQGWDGQQLTERRLADDQVASYLQSRASLSDAADGNLRCIVRADRNVKYENVEVVLRACGLAKISKISFSANTGLDPEGAR